MPVPTCDCGQPAGHVLTVWDKDRRPRRVPCCYACMAELTDKLRAAGSREIVSLDGGKAEEG